MAKRDITSGLRALGSGSLHEPEAGPSREILEAFPNRFPDRLYIVSIVFPEYTSLCPVTGQPDFGTIAVEYIPDQLCVESKSFKLYMFAYRSHQSFMETITNSILDDLFFLLNPWWCRVKGLFAPRGGTQIHVFADKYKEAAPEQKSAVRLAVQDWLKDGHPDRLA